jgi:IclR family transcriptional regulator, acetate operon repressor
MVRGVSDPSGPAYPIESVDRALTILLAFEDEDTLTISGIARVLGVSRSTAFRLLSTLEHRGFVTQDRRTKAFHGGPALLRVGLAAVNRSDLRTSLRPLLERIVGKIDETGHAVILQRGDAFFLDCVEGSRMIRATPRTGSALPAHLTAGGKALLASLAPARLDELLDAPLVALTSKSNIVPAKIRRELEKVRQRGWAVNRGETEEQLRAVAVFVSGDVSGTGVDAAITVAGPAQRLRDGSLDEIGAMMLACVEEFAQRGPIPSDLVPAARPSHTRQGAAGGPSV